MRITGTAKTVRVLKELVSIWDKIKGALFSIQKITGTGAAVVRQTQDGINIHVSPSAVNSPDEDRSLVGKWAFLVDYDAIGNGQNNYSADIYVNIGDDNEARAGVAVRNSWEWENTSSVQAGYEIVTSDPACGDITGIEVLPMNEWYPIVGTKLIGGVYHVIISQRNDPTIEPA